MKVWKMFFPFKQLIFRFQGLIFQGKKWAKATLSKHWRSTPNIHPCWRTSPVCQIHHKNSPIKISPLSLCEAAFSRLCMPRKRPTSKKKTPHWIGLWGGLNFFGRPKMRLFFFFGPSCHCCFANSQIPLKKCAHFLTLLICCGQLMRGGELVVHMYFIPVQPGTLNKQF